MAAQVNQRPLIRVQPDWNDVCAEHSGSFWVYYNSRREGEKAIHYHVHVSNTAVDADPPFRVTSLDTQFYRWIELAYTTEQASVQSRFIAPTARFTKLHPTRNVYSVDISPGGELGVTGGDSGSLKVFNTKDGTVLRDLKEQGHVGDVNTCRFFPSGTVVLSGSSDWQLKIWSATEGYCAATLRGHSLGITSTSIIDRGRNIISTSRDGTAKLWDVSTQTTIVTFGTTGGSALNGSFVMVNPLPSSDPPAIAANEVSTADKLLLVASEAGEIIGYDLATKKPVFTLPGKAAMNCVTAIGGTTVVSGDHEGRIAEWDFRSVGRQPRLENRLSSSPVLCLAPHSTANRYFVGTADGLLFEWDSVRAREVAYYTGIDMEPVYSVAIHPEKRFILSGSRDGLVRKHTWWVGTE